MRLRDKLSFGAIGKLLCRRKQTIHLAFKRYQERGCYIDMRDLNGRNNKRRKIDDAMQARLLDRELLQRWSGYTLGQRCMLLKRDFDLTLSEKGLEEFYKRNKVGYIAVGYIYCQALAKHPAAVEAFSMKLAKVIRSGEPLVYFDEASFNLWLRGRKTWSPTVNPIKYPLGKNRGKGITVMGAISPHLGKPLFELEESTNAEAFRRFLVKLRDRFPWKQT